MDRPLTRLNMPAPATRGRWLAAGWIDPGALDAARHKAGQVRAIAREVAQAGDLAAASKLRAYARDLIRRVTAAAVAATHAAVAAAAAIVALVAPDESDAPDARAQRDSWRAAADAVRRRLSVFHISLTPRIAGRERIAST